MDATVKESLAQANKTAVEAGVERSMMTLQDDVEPIKVTNPNPNEHCDKAKIKKTTDLSAKGHLTQGLTAPSLLSGIDLTVGTISKGNINGNEVEISKISRSSLRNHPDAIKRAIVKPKATISKPPGKPFKQRKTFETRQLEVKNIRQKFPTKIPVVVEKYSREVNLPVMDKTKFLVPQEITVMHFAIIIKNKLCVPSSRAFYFVVNNQSMASTSKTMAEVYKEHKDEDGFLYMTYASQEMFG